MRIYKANLGLLQGRYGEFERRMLDDLAHRCARSIRLPVGYRPLLLYLIRDGILSEPVLDRAMGHALAGDTPMAGVEQYDLTAAGTEFLAFYASARSLGGLDGDGD